MQHELQFCINYISFCFWQLLGLHKIMRTLCNFSIFHKNSAKYIKCFLCTIDIWSQWLDLAAPHPLQSHLKFFCNLTNYFVQPLYKPIPKLQRVTSSNFNVEQKIMKLTEANTLCYFFFYLLEQVVSRLYCT